MPRKFSLNDAIKIAESHGGKCLSKEYINCEIPMLGNVANTINGSVLFDLSKIVIHGVLTAQIENSIFQWPKNWHAVKMDGVFLRITLILTHLFYGNVKIFIGFSFLFQMSKMEKIALVITDVLQYLGNVLKGIHGLLESIVFNEGDLVPTLC
ncbi:4998_t:CDS:2, partial [Acaulospora morrowiae]